MTHVDPSQEFGSIGVGLAGLGAVGRPIARAIATGLAGYHLTGIAVGRPDRARVFLQEAGIDAPLVDLAVLAEQSQIVVEALPPDLFATLAADVLRRGKRLIVLSVGALLANWELVDLADRSGGQILVPSGAILGLDALQGAREGEIRSVSMVTRKPTRGLVGAPFLEGLDIDLEAASEPILLFRGTAREAITGFPANLNVAVAIALAGIGPDRTHLEVWADPDLSRNIHEVEVDSDAAVLRFSIENVPTSENPRTGRLTAQSVIALLRKLESPLRIGT